MVQTATIEPSGAAAERQGSDKFVVRRVGVIGLGNMGHALAVNLIEDGYQVCVFDRNCERIMAMESITAIAVESLRDLAGCDAVVTSLPNDDALSAVALGPEGLAAVLSAGAVHISTSTVSPPSRAESPTNMRGMVRTMSLRRCWATRISLGRANSSCLRALQRGRSRTFGRSSSVSVSGCS